MAQVQGIPIPFPLLQLRDVQKCIEHGELQAASYLLGKIDETLIQMGKERMTLDGVRAAQFELGGECRPDCQWCRRYNEGNAVNPVSSADTTNSGASTIKEKVS